MMSGDGCSATCQNEIVGTGSCGDGIVQTPNSSGFNEQCDDANSDNGDACLNSCESNTCGDSYLYTGFEECDDGNLLD
jgi:cysteine-rich repeat protein